MAWKTEVTQEEIIRIIEPHCKIGTEAIRLLRRDGIEAAIKHLRKYGVREDQIEMLKLKERNKLC